MNPTLYIKNQNQLITETNFWLSDFNRESICFLSFNASALRVLVPKKLKKWINEMKTAKTVVITRIKTTEGNFYEVVFDDYSVAPFRILSDARAADRLLPKSQEGNEMTVSVWYPDTKGEPTIRLKRSGVFRYREDQQGGYVM